MSARDPRRDADVPRFYVDPQGPYVCDRTRPKGEQSFFLSSRHADQMAEVLNFLEGAKEGGHSPNSLWVLEEIVRESRENHHRREPLAYGPNREEPPED